MALDLTSTPPWLCTVLLAEDDTEESVLGSDDHQDAIKNAHGPRVEYAREQNQDSPLWYVCNSERRLTAIEYEVRLLRERLPGAGSKG